MSERDEQSADGDDTPPVASPDADTVQVLDLLVLLARGRTLLFATIVVFVVGGLAYGLLASSEYRSTARVVPESQSEMPQGVGGLGGGLSALQGLGINLGNLSSQGLSTNSYPEILKSREVRLAVVRDTFRLPGRDTTGTLVDYFVADGGMLSRLKQKVQRYVFGPKALRPPGRTGIQFPTLAEERAMHVLQERVTAYQNPETGLMTVSVSTGDARLSAAVARSFIEQLSDRVRALRTEKERQYLKFIRSRFKEAERELSAAEERLATFVDRNQSISTAALRTQRDRLERQVQFKTDLYSELQAQLTQARIELQRSEPVITMVEKPVPPLEPTSPQRLVILVLCVLGGGISGIGLVLLRAYFREENTSGARRAKIEEVREAFHPSGLVQGVQERLHSWPTNVNSDD